MCNPLVTSCMTNATAAFQELGITLVARQQVPHIISLGFALCNEIVTTGKVVIQSVQEARMLKIALQKVMQDKGLSSHKAAEAIGVSHTTILRALRGETVDV